MLKIRNLKDPDAEQTEREFWSLQSIAFKLEILETIRGRWAKLEPKADGDLQRLRRVLRITQQT
ncbi:hypothetical protein MYX84_09915 [Acidobacteria bacterium AH-259-O06]|nr:hypothetical protein [Acidobacteria bacterium AH-259-O06]